MTGWAKKLPIVTPILAKRPKRVTLILPYYESHEFFSVQCEALRNVPRDLATWLNVIVVDDGSPTKPLRLPDVSLPLNFRAFRIERDIPWNWLAARNIGAHHAVDGWLLLTDMDHVVPDDTLRSVIWGAHDPASIYVFSRQEHTGATIPPHSASFLMHRQLFWKIGGYDERLSGHYGCDGVFRRDASRFAPMRVLTDRLIRHEYVKDSSVTTYARKMPSDAAAVKIIVASREPNWRPKVLSVPYHEVTA